ncbi:hypothetical protein BH09BAC4_BH09BAC4_08650 [soil metagenome]
MTESDLKNFLRQPYESVNQKTLLGYLFGDGLTLFTQPQILIEATENVRLAQQIGSVALSDGRNLAIMDVAVTDTVHIARNRKGLRKVAADYIDQNIIHGALVFYHGAKQADYRLSLIAKYAEFDLETGDLKKEETKPKRYTFLLGPNESCTTAAKRLGDLINNNKKKRLKELEDAFSVERLNRDFFKEYRWHYERFWRFIAENELYASTLRDTERPTKDLQDKPIRDFAKKLLGRMVFLYFLQKKGWMGCTDGLTEWVGGDPFFVRSLFEKFPKPDQFYSQCLTTLFFKTLNVKRPGDRFTMEGMTPCRVPYLNGGLFEDTHEQTSGFDFPPTFFQDLLQFFDQYNFTIDENSPDEQEVGIDPEMLGHIFENLLEENRDKGTFYTPKSIVYYICRESLINYLAPGLPDEADIEGFVKRHVVSPYLSQPAHANALNARLDAVRVCDPAIGSGAFPIAMLQEIYNAKLHLYPYRNTAEAFDPAEVKLGIIENSISGVDLDGGAVDIARLRFWLTLVVDEDAPRQLPNLDYKIMQGNSLFEQFQGVDLSHIGTDKDVEIKASPSRELTIEGMERPVAVTVFDQTSREELFALIHDYFDPKHVQADKQIIRRQINAKVEGRIQSDFARQKLDLRVDIEKQEKEWRIAGVLDRLNTRSKPYKDYQIKREKLQTLDEKEIELIALQDKPNEKPYFLWHLFFHDVFAKGGFDIVIGNPPYFSVSKQPSLKALKDLYETYEPTGDIYSLFYELGYRLLREGGVLAYITGSSWLRSNYGRSLRNFFRTKTNPQKLIDFSDSEIFESATVRTTTLVFRKESNANQLEALRLTRRTQRFIQQLDAYFKEKHIDLDIQHEKSWVVLTKEHMTLKNLVESKGKTLADLDWVKINRGILTGFNEAFELFETDKEALIQEDQNSEKIIKPWLRGRDLKAYTFVNEGRWLINTHNGIKAKHIPRIDVEKDYPAIYKHLSQPKYKDALIKRFDQGDHWTNLRNCAYLEDFDKPKLIYPQITKDLTFCYDEAGFFTNDRCFIATGEHLKYLLVWFNSRLFRYCFEEDFPEVEGNARELRKVFMEEVQVIKPSAEEEARLGILADYLLYLHNDAHKPVNPYLENRQVAIMFEDIANHLVCELYFADEMREKGVDLASVLKLEPLDNEQDVPERGAAINRTYQNIQVMGSPVRDRLKLVIDRLPENAGRILSNVR